MQSAVGTLRQSLWKSLEVEFKKFPIKNGQMELNTVEDFVRTVLGEQTQQEVDYVMKNIFRLDADKSGTVDFRQMANFLFQYHCAEISLQIMHRNGKMSRGADRKMTFAEFQKLLNNAWKFLKVSVQTQTVRQIFNDADKDKDGLITYVEYFQFIIKHICRTQAEFDGKQQQPVVQKPVDLGPERFSRLRKWIWEQLFKLYSAYIGNRTLSVNDQQLRGLVLAILGDLSELEVTFLLSGLIKLADKTIQFEPFAMIFIYLVAELGLARYSQNHGVNKKQLNKDEFVVLFRNSFKVFNVSRIRQQFLWKIFAKIDKNKDGYITFEEYLDWAKRFLAVLKYFGDEFWVTPDDDLSIEGDWFLEKQKVVTPQKVSNVSSKIKFTFSNYDFAKQVRQRMYEKLVPFDRNKDQLFDEKQITDAIINLLRENEHEVYYMVKNVFRYDHNDDAKVTYDELTNFCVEQHFGEMAIQRLHRKKGNYSRSDKRQMNKSEFANTLSFALRPIDLQAPTNVLDLLWSEIDLQKSGWITYQVYFLFLKYYFGSQRMQSQPADEWDLWLKSLKGLSPMDYFVRLIVDQLEKLFLKYDANKNLVFEVDEIENILRAVFQLNEDEVSGIIFTYFRIGAQQGKAPSFKELVAIILVIFFVDVIVKRKYNGQTQGLRFNLQQFIAIIREYTFFLRFKPENDLLAQVFEIIDTDRDGWITWLDYVNFIKKYLGAGFNVIQDTPQKVQQKQIQNVPGISAEQVAFVEAIWGELKKYFDQYDKGSKKYLNEEQVKAFVMEVLKQTSKRELDYVFWNLFRIDPDGNRRVEFQQFAPFILSHAGEIALQRFHKEQVKGKSSLSSQQTYIVFSNAFSFLQSLSKHKAVITSIHRRIGNGSNPNYAQYLGWVNLALARRFR